MAGQSPKVSVELPNVSRNGFEAFLKQKKLRCERSESINTSDSAVSAKQKFARFKRFLKSVKRVQTMEARADECDKPSSSESEALDSGDVEYLTAEEAMYRKYMAMYEN